jgi:hypothetical protein
VNPDPADHPHSSPVSRRRQKRVDPTNFQPGHSVHWIQAKKAAETLHEAEIGRIVRIDQQGIHVNVKGELRRYGTRDLARVEALVAAKGNTVRIQHRWALMHLNGGYLISVRGPL